MRYSRAVFAARRPWLWAIVALLLAWGLVVAARGKASLPPPTEGGSNDLQMYSAVTARVAAGENYYRVLAEELPNRGYAIRPVFNWRLPTVRLDSQALRRAVAGGSDNWYWGFVIAPLIPFCGRG